jgi:hypothetical protein
VGQHDSFATSAVWGSNVSGTFAVWGSTALFAGSVPMAEAYIAIAINGEN